MSVTIEEPIAVLHVDDEPAILDITERYLEREEQTFDVRPVESAAAGLEILETDAASIDCVVSDFRMPETNGLEFLEAVRDDHPDLPFVLFTGQGSEEIAIDAIRAGVTDYLQKGTDPSQYTVLANRIANAAAQFRLEREVEHTRRRFEKLVEHTVEVIPILDAEGVIQYVTPSSERVLGYEPTELVGEQAFDYVHPEDLDRTVGQFMKTVENPDSFPEVEYRFRGADGEWVHLFGRAKNMLDDPAVEGIVSYNRDVTDLYSGDGAPES